MLAQHFALLFLFLIAGGATSGEIIPPEGRNFDPATAFCANGNSPTMLPEALPFCNITGLSCCTKKMDADLEKTFRHELDANRNKNHDVNEINTTFKKFLCKQCNITMKTSEQQAQAADYVIISFVAVISVASVLYAVLPCCCNREEPAIRCGNNNRCCFFNWWGHNGGAAEPAGVELV